MITDLLLGVRWMIALMWLMAGVGKLAHHRATVISIREYGLIPDSLAVKAAKLLAIGEILLGAALALGLGVSVTASVAGVVLIFFAAAVAWNLSHGRVFDCGCGLTEGMQISWLLVFRNLFFALVCGAVAYGPPSRLALTGAANHAPGQGIPALIAIPLVVVTLGAGVRLVMTVRPLARAHERREATFVGDGVSLGVVISGDAPTSH